jgi:hypothetical protein
MAYDNKQAMLIAAPQMMNRFFIVSIPIFFNLTIRCRPGFDPPENRAPELSRNVLVAADGILR